MILLVGLAHAASVTLNPGDDVAGLTSSLAAGDEIVFNAGTYVLEGSVTWTGVGTASEPIVIRGDGQVILELAQEGNRTVILRDSAHVQISGLTIQGAAGWEDFGNVGLEIYMSTDVSVTDCVIQNVGNTALYLSGDTANIELRGNEIHGVARGHGIYAGCGNASCWTQDTVVAENLIHDLRDERSYAIAIDNGGQGVTVTDNVLFQGAYRGIEVKSTELGAANVVEGNALWSFASTAIRAQGPSIVRNNLVFNMGGKGIYSSGSSGDEVFYDVVISHNTVVDTADYGIELHDWAGREGMVLANNAVSNPTGYGVWVEDLDDAVNVITGNVVTGLVTGLDPLAGHFAAGGGDRDFADALGWDFYPSDTSFLVDQGDPSGSAWVPELDFNGAPRQGDAPDAGAYEWRGGDNPGWAVQEDFKELGYDDQGEVQQVTGCCQDSDDAPVEGLLLFPLLALAGLRRRA